MLKNINNMYDSGMKQVSIDKARPKLGDIIDRVRYTSDDPVVITRHGQPAAMITRVLAPRDREHIAQAYRMTQPAYLLAPEEARSAIAELLDILVVYLNADLDARPCRS